MFAKQIVLVGIGHTNAHVLYKWRRSPLPGARLVCVSNFAVSTYSGMLPGSLTGQYPPHKMEIDLTSLVRAARGELVIAPACAIDLNRQSVRFPDFEPVRFDLLSVGVGSVPDTSTVRVSGRGFIPIKPMQTFLMRLYERVRIVVERGGARIRSLIVGGGVGGVEVALCLPAYLRRIAGEKQHTISLVEARDRIGHGLSSRAAQKVEELLHERTVNVVTGRRVECVTDEGVYLDDRGCVEADLVIWAAGGVAPPLLDAIDLPKDPQGFLLTRDTLQSTGADNVFAVGDTGTVEGMDMPKAGVYAVREGPVLWKNLRSLVKGRPPSPYVPQGDFLRLINTGDGKALMDYKGWAVHARWCWLLKDWIDSRFISRFRLTRN